MMTYFNKNSELKQGYNAYIDAASDDMGTQMDVGLLVMEAGDTVIFEEGKKEIAVLLFAGKVTYQWNGETVEAVRPDCFHHEAYCLLASRETKVTLTGEYPDSARGRQRRTAGLHEAGDQDIFRL